MSVTPIVALDVGSLGEALAVAAQLAGRARFYKVGSELFTAAGPAVVGALRERGAEVFLDLKFHDIPNTVAGAVRSARALGARIVTVHSSGGQAMLEAASEAAGDACLVAAVSVLTSLDGRQLGAAWGRDLGDLGAEVVRLARLAVASGVGGLVCSGEEAALVRGAVGDRLRLIIPGIRFAGGAVHDQRRVMTPGAAARAGADYLVVGRAVTAAEDPAAAFERLQTELDSALKD